MLRMYRFYKQVKLTINRSYEQLIVYICHSKISTCPMPSDFVTHPISKEQALKLYQSASTQTLMSMAMEMRYQIIPLKRVSWQIDRNVNITNVCVSGCLFCNFHCTKHNHQKAFITTIEEYRQKIDELRVFGGDQLLLQGGLHPDLDITFYESLFHQLKTYAPNIKLHALGPPEITHIASISHLTPRTVLERLHTAGLDSLPGAGAEILSDRVRKIISPGKPDTQSWLNVMHHAHQMGLITSATMVFGHIETLEERINHLISLRELQAQKPNGAPGFLSFICWPMCTQGTKLAHKELSPVEYLRTVAISRIVLYNIPNIQASWLTVGVPTAQLSLFAGANDLGSIMIEENVLSSAGKNHRLDAAQMQEVIKRAGFEPWLRDQRYRERD